MDDLIDILLDSYRRWLRNEFVGQNNGELYRIYNKLHEVAPEKAMKVKNQVLRGEDDGDTV